MEELLAIHPQPRVPKKGPVPLDRLAGIVLDYLLAHPRGETVNDLALNLQVTPTSVRKVLEIISTVLLKIVSRNMEGGTSTRLLLTRSPRNTITGARLESGSSTTGNMPSTPHEGEQQKPVYVMEKADIAAIQRAWKLYKATGRALQGDEAARFSSLREKYPSLFTTNGTKEGLLPTVALFAVVKKIEEYAILGRLPHAIETPVATITLKGGV